MATDVKKTKAEPTPKASEKAATAAEKSTPAADATKPADLADADTATKTETSDTTPTAPKN